MGIGTKTQTLLVKAGFHHPKSDIHRLYFSHENGGRTLSNFFDCFRQEMTALTTYLETTKGNYLVNIVKEEESRLQW